MSQAQDAIWVQEVLEGDTESYRSLINAHQAKVFQLVFRIIGNREEAEEIAQDAFIKAWQSLSAFKNKSKFSTWMYRIAFNTAISAQRKRKFHWTELNEEHTGSQTEEAPDQEDETLKDLQHELLPQALSSLKNEHHLLLSLYYYQNQSISEISEVTDLSKSNVKVRLFRARKELHQRMESCIAQQKMMNA